MRFKVAFCLGAFVGFICTLGWATTSLVPSNHPEIDRSDLLGCYLIAVFMFCPAIGFCCGIICAACALVLNGLSRLADLVDQRAP